MKKHIILLLPALLAVTFMSFLSTQAIADPSERVEVYSISQSFWDVTPGETLRAIVKQLLPDNPGMRERFQSEIVLLNPNAFSQSNPDNLKANIRLWLPNNATAIQGVKNKSQYEVKSFSWGQVYKPRRD